MLIKILNMAVSLVWTFFGKDVDPDFKEKYKTPKTGLYKRGYMGAAVLVGLSTVAGTNAVVNGQPLTPDLAMQHFTVSIEAIQQIMVIVKNAGVSLGISWSIILIVVGGGIRQWKNQKTSSERKLEKGITRRDDDN